MTAAHHQSIFGRTPRPHTVIIAHGEEVRHFTVHPWLVSVVALLSSCAVLGIAAGAFIFMSEPGWTLFPATQADGLAVAYETRIASLRSEVDRLTTRGFIDREKVSSKVDVLLDQQAELSKRYAKLQPLLDRARSNGILAVPVPVPKPVAEGDALPAGDGPLLSFTETEGKPALDRFRLVDKSDADKAEDRAEGDQPGTAISPDLIRRIGRSIDEAEIGQIDGLNILASKAKAKSDAIGSVLRTEGIGYRSSKAAPAGAEGGPFVPVPQDRLFDAGIENLRTALDALQAARETSTALPLAAPVASGSISSGFGVRSDPFLGKAAMHTGIDFVAEAGSAVRATAAGKVVFAGDNGTYGRMVEIDHGNGLTTRYAHMSSILVGLGDAVTTGALVGRVGSTGRSTGPHLHYELRRTGDAVDPARYLRAGRRITALG